MAITRSMISFTQEGSRLRYSSARLVVTRGVDRGTTFALADRPTILGTGRTADLRLADPRVSREHALVLPSGSGWRVRDLNSKNGTWLEGIRVDQAPLSKGAVVRVGDTEIHLRTEDTELEVPPQECLELDGLLAVSDPMRRLFGLVQKVAGLGLPALVHGESGTGKERLAHALHRFGPEPDGPYEVVDCTLLQGEHLRSELFGHRKGAFTGADEDRCGSFERADGGTLFLDEVAEIPLEIQGALLRVLEVGEVRPLGGDQARRVRVRVVSATNKDLEAEVEAGRFRSDLYFRLAAVTLEVPPLRSRPEDVVLLARHFAGEGVALSEDLIAALKAYPWPGNVRQLRNALVRAVGLAAGGPLSFEDLGLRPVCSPPPGHDPTPPSGDEPPPLSREHREAMSDLERQRIVAALELHGGNRRRAAEHLGIPRSTFYEKIKKLGIE